MAEYRIVCTRQVPADRGNHGHIIEVGIGTEPSHYSEKVAVATVRSMIDQGHVFFTVGATSNAIALVEKYTCCGVYTLRSNSDAVTDNNLDSLPGCG